MEDNKKTKKQLIEELKELRQRVAASKGFEEEIKQTRVNHEKFTKAFLQNSIPASITTLKEGRFVDVSDAFLRLIGRRRDEVIGHTSIEIGFITKEQRASFFNELNKKGRIENFEMAVGTKDGALRYGLFNAVMMSLENETYLLTVMIDITDRKQMEEELLRAHKLESLGVLAGGIAHDFNNLMAIVQGNIDLALMELPSDHESCQRLLTAMRSVDQTRDLTTRLITFSRGGGPLTEVFDISEIIRAAVRRTVKGTEVRVKFGFMENLWPVEVDEHQMNQVFYNLTTNAVEAMPQGGNLSIQAENALIPAGEIIDLKEGSYLKITFADEGISIHEEHLSKIFDPYFTTKKMAAQKGLGLGLSVCYSVLKKHGGHITVKSQPGKGASFVLYLPARADLARAVLSD